MSPRQLSILAAIVVSLGGAVTLGVPLLRSHPPFSPPIAQLPPEPDALILAQAGSPPEQGWLRDLNLSPDQVKKIQAIRDRNKNQFGDRRRSLRQTHEELRELMAGDASVEQIRQKYAEVKTLREEMADARFNSMLEMREVLTPEQRRTFADRMQKQRQRWGERGERGDRGRDRMNRHSDF